MFANPLKFIHSPQSDFYAGNEYICQFECDFIKQTQNADGTWNVTWQWDAFDEQWSISKNWWKSELIIRNRLYLQSLDVKVKTL